MGKVSTCVAFMVALGMASGDKLSQKIRREQYPYMGFLYFMDDSIKDWSGGRFFRGAVLVSPTHLLSASIDVAKGSRGFPDNTLMARFGATTIDQNVNTNDPEQEREVIQIFQPSNYDAASWMSNDITVVRVINPFQLTAYVNITGIPYNTIALTAGTICSILVFQANPNATEERSIQEIFVEIQAAGQCGTTFEEEKMLCSAGHDKERKSTEPHGFCFGNAGGPLLCRNEVVALQSHFGQKCQPPHIYQRLDAWSPLIKCALQKECQSDDCKQICVELSKDQEDLGTDGHNYTSYTDAIYTGEDSSEAWNSVDLIANSTANDNSGIGNYIQYAREGDEVTETNDNSDTPMISAAVAKSNNTVKQVKQIKKGRNAATRNTLFRAEIFILFSLGVAM